MNSFELTKILYNSSTFYWIQTVNHYSGTFTVPHIYQYRTSTKCQQQKPVQDKHWFASTTSVLHANTENQYGTSTSLPVLKIVIIPDICQCRHQYWRSTAFVVNFLLGGCCIFILIGQGPECLMPAKNENNSNLKNFAIFLLSKIKYLDMIIIYIFVKPCLQIESKMYIPKSRYTKHFSFKKCTLPSTCKDHHNRLEFLK